MIACVVLNHNSIEETVLGLWIIDFIKLIIRTRKVVLGTVEPFQDFINLQKQFVSDDAFSGNLPFPPFSSLVV